MGNCTQPTSANDAEQATIPMGSFVKNSFLRRSQQQNANSNNLASNMPLKIFIYSKCKGLTGVIKDLGVSASNYSLQTTLAPQQDSTLETDAGPAGRLLLNYTVRYGSQEYTWVEHNCDSLHKAKLLQIDYRLGQVDQTV